MNFQVQHVGCFPTKGKFGAQSSHQYGISENGRIIFGLLYATLHFIARGYFLVIIRSHDNNYTVAPRLPFTIFLPK